MVKYSGYSDEETDSFEEENHYGIDEYYDEENYDEENHYGTDYYHEENHEYYDEETCTSEEDDAYDEELEQNFDYTPSKKQNFHRSNSGLYDGQGCPIRNLQAYLIAGGITYTKSGDRVWNPEKYNNQVQLNRAEEKIQGLREAGYKPATTYVVEQEGKRHYVGMSKNPRKRVGKHFNGKGSTWTRKFKPKIIKNINVHENESEARAAETEIYYRMRDYHGGGVRGAGHTSSMKNW